MSPGCSSSKAFSSACHLKPGYLMTPHIHLIQVSLSREVDMAYASALKVERTNLPICQTIGENSVVSFQANTPLWTNLAELQAALQKQNWHLQNWPKLISWRGIGRTDTDVSACCWASRSTLFPSSKVSTVAFGIPFCKQATLVAKSGLEWTAAYCKLPHNPLSWCLSWSFLGLSGKALRAFGVSIGFILWTYRLWFTLMEWSGSVQYQGL